MAKRYVPRQKSAQWILERNRRICEAWVAGDSTAKIAKRWGLADADVEIIIGYEIAEIVRHCKWVEARFAKIARFFQPTGGADDARGKENARWS